MIGVDTNIIIRYLTQDDTKQCHIVNMIMDDFEKRNQELWLSLVVVCEIVWVLESCYNQTKIQVNNAFMKLFEVQQFKVEYREIIQESFKDYLKYKKIDFSDCLIANCNKAKNCEYTLTFDKEASKLDSFKLLKPSNKS